MKKGPYCPPFINMLYMMGNCDCFPTSRWRMVACVTLDSGGGNRVGGGVVDGGGLVMTWMVGMQWPCPKTLALCKFRSFFWWLVRRCGE